MAGVISFDERSAHAFLGLAWLLAHNWREILSPSALSQSQTESTPGGEGGIWQMRR